MNPVKSRDSIRKAYTFFNVRNFAVDSLEELKKFMRKQILPMI